VFVSRLIAAVTWYMQDYVTARSINFISDSCRCSVWFMASVDAGFFFLSKHARKQNFYRSFIITTESVPNIRKGKERVPVLYDIE